MDVPTYRDLLKLLQETEEESNPSVLSLAEKVTARFLKVYPHIKIGRPGRFLETIRRIEAPIRNGRLKGSDKILYLKRKWLPRTRNTSQCRGRCVVLFFMINNWL